MRLLIVFSCEDKTCEKHKIKILKDDLVGWLTDAISEYWQENPNKDDVWAFRDFVQEKYDRL